MLCFSWWEKNKTCPKHTTFSGGSFVCYEIMAYHLLNHENLTSSQVVESNKCTVRMTISKTDTSMICSLVEDLLSIDDVEFASSNEVHPLTQCTELLVRVKEGVDLPGLLQTTLIGISHRILNMDWELLDDDRASIVEENKVHSVSNTLVIKNVNTPLANSVRRTMIESIPTLAISEVTFRRNTSVYPDEIIAQRISLIPIRTEDNGVPRSVDVNGRISINVHVPEDIKRTVTYIYSDQMEVTTGSIQPAFSTKDSGIPIVALAPGQGLDMVAKVSIGTGAEHARHMCVSTVGFRKTKDYGEGMHDYSLKFMTTGQICPASIVKATKEIMATKLHHLRQSIEMTLHDVCK